MTKIYYGPNGNKTAQYMLVPAPTINIGKELAYANDTIVGYTYTVNLQGYISNYRHTDDSIKPENDPDYNTKNIQKVLGGIEIVRKILSRNGSNLTILDATGSTVILCKGGTLRSLNFDETENNWSVYAQYSATIEFNEIEFMGETVACGSSDIDASSKSPNLVNLDTTKIKSFTDGWTFSVTEQSFDYVRLTENGKNLQIQNMIINASYNINVTGKNYYVNDQLVPAHEQARLFAQKRLYDRVTQLVVGNTSNLFKVTTDNNAVPCGSDTLNSIHIPGSGILGNITYLPHNENVNCEISESDGTFSANYSCTLKSKATGMTHSAQSVIHTVSRSRNREAQSASRDNYTISIEGTIQGLVLGGLIYSGGNFSLPSNGSFVILGTDSVNKYSNALSFYNTIGNDEDLIDAYKDILGISFTELNVAPSNCSGLPAYPKPTSFNLTRNFIEGNISYTAEYSSTNACNTDGEQIRSISITTENPVPVLAEFIVPNGEPPRFVLGQATAGTIIQDINTVTAKKISITIEGRKQKTRVCCHDINTIISNVACSDIELPSTVKLPDPSLYVLTQKSRTENKMEGTFNISLSYMCVPGCDLL